MIFLHILVNLVISIFLAFMSIRVYLMNVYLLDNLLNYLNYFFYLFTPKCSLSLVNSKEIIIEIDYYFHNFFYLIFSSHLPN